ncbi:MAG: hypothetical protein LLG06_04080 [Desulfobacteraceae bacterium]|nr:hypothetical protein [Desulfobacteraceae bacterium]
MILGPELLNHLIESHGMVIPFDKHVVTNSVDLSIGKIFKHSGDALLTTENRSIGKLEEVPLSDGEWVLEPNSNYIAVTLEEVNVPPYLAAKGISRSTLIRAGVIATTGYIDPGYSGAIHFGLTTPGPNTTRIGFGFRAIQLVFESAEPNKYNGAYQGGRLYPSLS